MLPFSFLCCTFVIKLVELVYTGNSAIENLFIIINSIIIVVIIIVIIIIIIIMCAGFFHLITLIFYFALGAYFFGQALYKYSFTLHLHDITC